MTALVCTSDQHLLSYPCPLVSKSDSEYRAWYRRLSQDPCYNAKPNPTQLAIRYPDERSHFPIHDGSGHEHSRLTP
jgi:hypothetical protein